MSVVFAVTLTMALLGAGLGIARARRAAADGTAVHADHAQPLQQGAVRWIGLCLLLGGGLGVQLVEGRYPPLSRVDLLVPALPLGLALAAGLALALGRRAPLLANGPFALLGVPALTYALLGAVNGAFDGAAVEVRAVTVVEKRVHTQRNDGRRHVLVLQAAGAPATPLAMTVDAHTFAAIAVGRDSALLTTHRGRLGIRWAEPSRDLNPLPPAAP